MLISFSLILLIGCAQNKLQTVTVDDSSKQLPPGAISLSLSKNITTKTDVMRKFGNPDIVSQSSEGSEVWTYQKTASIIAPTDSSSYGTIIVTDGVEKNANVQSDAKAMTLIITFNTMGKVSDFKNLTVGN